MPATKPRLNSRLLSLSRHSMILMNCSRLSISTKAGQKLVLPGKTGCALNEFLFDFLFRILVPSVSEKQVFLVKHGHKVLPWVKLNEFTYAVDLVLCFINSVTYAQQTRMMTTRRFCRDRRPCQSKRMAGSDPARRRTSYQRAQSRSKAG